MGHLSFRFHVTLLFGAISIVYLISGYWKLRDPGDYFVPDGTWQAINGDIFQATVAAGEPTTLKLNMFSNIAAVYCLAWEAEQGPGSLSLAARYRDMNTPDGYWTEVLPEPFCMKNVDAEVTVYSPHRQTVQVARLLTSRSPGRRTLGYVVDLCQKTFRHRECDDVFPVTPTLVDRQDVVRSGTWNLAFSAMMGLSAIINQIGFFKILTALFPSRNARRVRAELRRAALGGTAFDPAQTEPYRQPAPSAFQRQQDIEELKGLVSDAHAEAARLAEAEDQAKHEAAIHAQLASDFQRSIKKIRELEAKLDQMKRPK